jgi:hypothetical protein
MGERVVPGVRALAVCIPGAYFSGAGRYNADATPVATSTGTAEKSACSASRYEVGGDRRALAPALSHLAVFADANAISCRSAPCSSGLLRIPIRRSPTPEPSLQGASLRRACPAAFRGEDEGIARPCPHQPEGGHPHVGPARRVVVAVAAVMRSSRQKTAPAFRPSWRAQVLFVPAPVTNALGARSPQPRSSERW